MPTTLQKPRQNSGTAGNRGGAPRPATRRGPSRGRRVVVGLIAAAVVACGGVAAVNYWNWWPGDVCLQCERFVADASDEAVPAAMTQLEACGPDGLSAIVRLLNSPRDVVRVNARERLSARLASLRTSDTATEAAALSAIAAGLEQLTASQAGEMHAEAVAVAWELLEAVGNLSLEERIAADVRGRLLVACDNVLERPMPAVSAAKSTKPTWIMPVGVGPALPVATQSAASPTDMPAAANSGEIPANSETASLITTSQRDESTASGKMAGNVGSSPNTGTSGSDPLRSAANSAARVNPMRAPQEDVNVQPASASPSHAPREVVEPPFAATPVDLATRTAWSLFADMRQSGSIQAASAEAELLRRGFSSREMELGKHLTSPDDDERRRHAETLPSFPGVALRPWLLHLCDDPSPDVRLTAAAIMGTTNDPALLARLRDLGVNDADDRVRNQANRATSTPK